MATAEAEFDQAAGVVSDLARRTRKLAEELPIDQRPEGDPLETLLELADTLGGHTEVLRPEIDRAEAAVAKASVTMEEALARRQLAGDANEGPQADDLLAGLESLLDEPERRPAGARRALRRRRPVVRADLLEIVRTCSTGRQVVLLTEDAEVLGWAIELPIDEAMALPADALLNRMRAGRHRPSGHGGARCGVPVAAVDITTSPSPDPDPDPDPEPAPTARRWAGQR